MPTSIFTTQTPSSTDITDGVPYTLGTLFTSSANGYITAIRWYFPATLPSGTVQARLYRWDNDTTGTLISGTATFSSPTAGTWNTVTLPVAVAITASQRYVATIFTENRYVVTNNFFASGTTNGVLTAPADDAATPARNGRFLQNATFGFPTSTFSASCYFVDVVYQAGIMVTTSTVVKELNRLAGITNPANFRDAQGAANLWAGTTNLDLVHALNVKAGVTNPANFKDLQGICNQLAGTSGLGPPEALSQVVS